MKKVFKMTMHELKQLRKVIMITLLTIFIITAVVIFAKKGSEFQIAMLSFADLIEKMLLPLFIYIGSKDYLKSLNNTLQINQKRSLYLFAKSLSIIIIAFVIGLLTTPISYYLKELGQYDFGDFIMPVFIGVYSPIVPVMFNFDNVIVVSIIASLIYAFISHLTLLAVALFYKIGGIKLFIVAVVVAYLFNYLNTILVTKYNKYDLINRILGFAGVGVNLTIPVVSLSIIIMVLSLLTYITVNYTEV